MSIDIPSLTQTMITGVRNAISDRWPAIRAVAEPELYKIALTIEDVARKYAEGSITADRAAEIVEMQRNTAMSVVRTVEGLGILTAREALDAAAHAAGTAVNHVLGFELLSVKAKFKAGKDI